MPFEGKKRKSLLKRELRATHDTNYLEQLLSLVWGSCRNDQFLELVDA